MKIGPFIIGKDGGPDSKVHMFGIEVKSLFSVLLLRFDPGTREAYHSHAFGAHSLVLGPGFLHEQFLAPDRASRLHHRGGLVYTARTDVHKVKSVGTTWVLTLRGPWADRWVDVEYRDGAEDTWYVNVLAHGRKILRTGLCFCRAEAARVAAAWASR